MKKIIITLLIIIHMGITNASNTMSAGTQAHVNADIARIHEVNLDVENTRGLLSFTTIGADTQCEYSNIQDALDDFVQVPVNFNLLRIAKNKTYHENLVINNSSITLVGGYSDCQAANSGVEPSGRTIIDGDANGSVLRITTTASNTRRTIILKNLFLTNGSSIGAGGGLLADTANARVSLVNVDINNNSAQYGAGIAIVDGDTDMTLQNSYLIGNVADYAGGLYCTGSTSSIVLTQSSSIVSNIANGTGDAPQGNGAGVFIDDRCRFSMYSGSVNNAFSGISFNYASGDGGGLYANNNAVILLNGHENCDAGNCIGDDINPVNVTGNEAGYLQIDNFRGGGIYARFSKVDMYAALVEGNSSTYEGGGIYVIREQLQIGRLHKACWDQLRCNYIKNNSSLKGGGIFNLTPTAMDVSSTYFEDNIAVDGVAIRLLTPNVPALKEATRFEGNVFNNNGNDETESIISLHAGMLEVVFVHNTIADNTASLAIFRVTNLVYTPFLQIHSSIIHNPGIPILSHDFSDYEVNISAVMANEIVSILPANNITNEAASLPGGAYLAVQDPLFADRNNRDYHLSMNSLAIDFINTLERTTIEYKDTDFEDWGIDDPNNQQNSPMFFYDLGADEFFPLADVIFKDGFE